MTIQAHLGMTGAARSDGDVDLDGDVDSNDSGLWQLCSSARSWSS